MAVRAQYPWGSMAVRAQYPCNNVFSPDFRTRSPMDPFHRQLQMLKHCVDADAGTGQMTSNNVSRPLKRSRVDNPSPPDLVTQLYQESLHVDALVQLQMERLRSGITERMQRHFVALTMAMEKQMSKMLGDKEIELDRATRWNAELGAMVQKLSAENQVWFSVAQNNEAVALGLRAELERHLVQCGAAPATAASVAAAEEGYGDSDDVRSCGGGESSEVARREDVELRRVGSCRGCGEGEAIVLLLPCRHLCICRDCEPRLDTCPVCNASKNASINVCMY